MGLEDTTTRTQIPVQTDNPQGSQSTPADQAMSEGEAKLAAIHADVDARMEPFDMAYKHHIDPRDAIKISIKRHYELGRGSIQDLARVYNVSVPDVLKVCGIEGGETVEVLGDLIDEEEAGANVELNEGRKFRVPYSLD